MSQTRAAKRSEISLSSGETMAAAVSARTTRVTTKVVKRKTKVSSASTSRPSKKPKIDSKPKIAPASSYTPKLLPPTLSFSLADATTHLAAHDPRFGRMVQQIPCKPFHPPVEAIDPFKTLVTSIIGQQVSWMAARAITKRFRALFGHEDEDGFPNPMQVANEDVLRLKSVGLSMRKAEYVVSLAQHFVEGKLSTELLRDGTDEVIAKALIAVRGIGQWTVDMFLIFSLRRPDILPVGDLGVQKGLLRWALAAHDALPKSKNSASDEARKKYGMNDKDQINTLVKPPSTPPRVALPLPPTPVTPNTSALHPATLHTPAPKAYPTTPLTPAVENFEIEEIPQAAPENLLSAMSGIDGWDAHRVVPLDGLSIDTMKARLGGKKAKGGAYLTPKEMETLTNDWRPYRSLGVYYMWPAGEDF